MPNPKSQRAFDMLQSDFRARIVWSDFVVWLLSDPQAGVSRYAYAPGHRESIERVCRLHSEGAKSTNDFDQVREFALSNANTAPPRMAIERAGSWAAEFAGDAATKVAALGACASLPENPEQLRQLLDQAALATTYGAQAGHSARAFRTACCPAEFHEILQGVRDQAEEKTFQQIEEKLQELLSRS